MLSSRVLRELTDRVLAMNEARDADALCAVATDAISALVPCDWPVISLATWRLPSVPFSFSHEGGEWLRYSNDAQECASEDPVYTARLRLQLDGPASTTAMSKPADLERTEYYQRVWKPLGLKRLMRYPSPGGLGFGVEVARTGGREFNSGEVEIVHAIGRHLDSAASRLVREHRGRLPMGGQMHAVQSFAWAVCDDSGRVLRTTPEATRRMRLCLGEHAPTDRIPQEWLDEAHRRSRGAPGKAFWRSIQGESMSVHIAPIRPTTSEYSVGFLTQPIAPTPLEALRRLGLTERQAEVLHWVAQGKSNPEIGIILGSSKLTVKKHLESIFHTLGVENRTAAAMLAIEAERRSQSLTEPA
jgi:DNA-binding CsgD family transcriptional regulator